MLEGIKEKIAEVFPKKGTIGYVMKHGNRAARRMAQSQVRRLEKQQHKQFQRQLKQG